MMNAVNENSQIDDDVQAFLPHQLEQNYLSCLLACDEIEAQETDAKEVDSKQLDAMSLQADQVPSQNDETKDHHCDAQNELAEGSLIEDSDVDTDVISHAILTDVSEEEINSCHEVSNNQDVKEPYMSVEKLSVSAPFVCQLMLISGVKFAVPLANFSRVISLPETVEINSNVASACFGKFEWQDKPMFLVALKQIMNPAHTKQDGALNKGDKIVLIENQNFGFVCNQILETVTISPEEVLWRDEFSQRYWLAGMVKESGFAILDVKGILCSATGNRQSATNN